MSCLLTVRLALFVIIGYCNNEIDSSKWSQIEITENEINEINYSDYLKFYWNTPILTASSDRELHPILQDKIFPNLFKLIKDIPQTDNRFGDIYNISQILKLLNNNDFNNFIDLYKKRIISWMGLYSRGQFIVNYDLSSIYLLILSPGDIIPLHGIFNFPVNNIFHESHDLISIMSIQPEYIYSKNEKYDGLFIYDPRNSLSGYGFSNLFIETSQYEQLNCRGGYLHIFPSGLKFNTLPTDYTRIFLISFAKLYSLHHPYRRQAHTVDDDDNDNNNNNINIYHFQNQTSKYLNKNDNPFFDQNIQFFSSFGTPIFHKSLDKNIDIQHFKTLSKCFKNYGQRTKSVQKSNRNGWQSSSDIFNKYKDIKWIIDDDIKENTKCIENIDILYKYIIKQISLWLLSFSNSHYFDDNGLIINFKTMNNNKLYIDIINSWININIGYAMNVPHFHPNSDLSGIIYIDINNGDLFFDDPRSNLFDNNPKLPFAQFNEPLQIKPKQGDIILFPNWLRHWVMPTYDDQNVRISFAFNIVFKTIHIHRDQQQLDNNDNIQFFKKEL